jgi:hypothetical protein
MESFRLMVSALHLDQIGQSGKLSSAVRLRTCSCFSDGSKSALLHADIEVNFMKFVLSLALLLFLSGITGSANAQPGRGQGNHPQARPAQQLARPVQKQERQVRPVARPQAHREMPTQQQHIQKAMRSQQQQVNPAGHAQQVGARPSHTRAQQLPLAGENRRGNQHGRISNAHYAARFGRGHSFHVRRNDYNHRRFQYGGYAFGFIDPWPISWGYSDDVYVVYTEDGYYMYNRIHPGLRISISIL